MAGWLGSSSLASRQAAVTSGSVTDPQETELLSRFEREELSEHEHRRLLERLLARERFDAAQQVLQPLLERHPERLHLILLRADLLRLSGSPGQARHHLDQLSEQPLVRLRRHRPRQWVVHSLYPPQQRHPE